MKRQAVIRYIPKIITAVILVQTLFFKFGIGGEVALNQSKALFSALTLSLFGSHEWEVYFRVGTGILELIASVLILIPAMAILGAFLGLSLMAGAILSHLFFIGISIDGDGGTLMTLAVVVLLCCAKTLSDEKEKLIFLMKKVI